MLTRTQITAFLALSVTFWTGMLLLRGVALTGEMLVPFSSVVAAVSACLFVFDRWIWHWPIFRGWLIKRPNLHGTWQAELNSDWINPETQAAIPPIRGFMVVRQTASALHFRLLTEESRSDTVSSGIEPCRDDTFEISCAYRNKPRALFRHRSEVHYGAMLLAADSYSPTRIEGEYWTDRKTTGAVTLTDKRRTLCATFEDARKTFT